MTKTKFFMRLLGAVNLLFVGFGVWYAVGMRSVRIDEGTWPPYPATWLDWLLYFVFLAVSTAFLGWLSYLSVRLFRADRRALLPTCVVFGVEIFFLWAQVTAFWLLTPEWVTKRSWFWTEGMDPLAPQFVYGYVFVGLIASLVLLLITRPKRHTTHRDSTESNFQDYS